MRLIPVYGGLFAKVDDADFPALSAFRWKSIRGKNTWYVARSVGDSTVYMHRQITGAPENLQVDHEDRDGLNNQRSNIRIATPAVNNQNRRTWGLSKFKGVSRKKNRWRARIRLNGKLIELGHFIEELDAAAAYDRAALSHYGPSASTNGIARTAGAA